MNRLSLAIAVLLVLLSAVFFWLTRDRPDGLYAEMDTSKGKVVFRLQYDKVPMTVSNFVALAEGTHELVTGEREGKPFYDGLLFHKVNPGVMVQGGDPRGTGNSGPGFRFRRELRPDLRHDRPGILSMLNDGAFSHGSQFFVTLQETSRYDDKHTIFGEVVKGQSVVDLLEEGDTIRNVSIIRQGDNAAAFDPAYHLKELAHNARQAEAEARRWKQEKADRQRKSGRRAELPKLTGKTDPARVPTENQPQNDEVALEYLLVSHKGAVPRTGKATTYDKPEARKIAEHLTALAREEGVDFVELAKKFSDSTGYRIPILTRDGSTAASLRRCFRLKPGQVTDPVDTPRGFMVFRRVPLERIQVRHILISYRNARTSTQTRTQEEARELAEQILRKAQRGEDFAELARKYSDSHSAREGGLIGEIVRGTTVPAFDHAAFSLEVGQISPVTLSPGGFQIIRRIK